jgi:hypothetical protein
MRLTDKERAALPAILASSKANGHDFGIVETIKWEGDRKSLGGILSSLQAKGVLAIADPVQTDAGWFTQYEIPESLLPELEELAKPLKLRDIMPAELTGGEYNDTRAYQFRDVEAVAFLHPGNRWPGSQRHVTVWAMLANGYAVGWNENPGKGWSFPCIKVPA